MYESKPTAPNPLEPTVEMGQMLHKLRLVLEILTDD
jgi:hypothetical protein